LEITKSLVLYFLLFINVNQVFSQDTIRESENIKEQSNQTFEFDEKLLIGGEIDFYQSDNVTNGIPYFDNRFRIDAELDEITLIFFRVKGSKPIILVQPDGKKIRVSDYDPETVKWHDDRTFDMIKMIKPMPGPWQAVGDILPESKILIVSEIKIEIDPLPEMLLVGETVKVEGKLYNGDKYISTPEFKEVVHLDVNFFSTNNPNYDNFGADALKLTSFKDDGHDLDEYAGDNIYTGEFVLDFPFGEWQPVFVIRLPLVERELRQKPILVHKSPITTLVTISENEATPHNLQLTIDPKNVVPSSLIFQGKITFPDKQTKPFSIVEHEDSSIRTQDIPYTEPGIHRVSLSAFGRTVSGREFRLVIPEFSFNVKPNINQGSLNNIDKKIATPLKGKEIELSVTEQQVKISEEQTVKLAKEIELQKALEQEKNAQTIVFIVVGNAIVIFIAIGLFLFLRRDKNKQ